MSETVVAEDGNVPDFETINEIKENGDREKLIKVFWEYGDVNSYDQEESGWCRDSKSLFYKAFRFQCHRVTREVTERYLIKLDPLISLLYRGIELASHFAVDNNPSLINEWRRDVNSFLSKEEYLIPIKKQTFFHQSNEIPYYFGHTEDDKHEKECFILANGNLKNTLVSFDVIYENSKEWLQDAYKKKIGELNDELPSEIRYLLFINKREQHCR